MNLESIAQGINYAELPETWWVPDIYRFSGSKYLYDYQRSAMENAACALFHYYGGEYDWTADESKEINDSRKDYFWRSYRQDKNYDKRGEVFRILSEYMDPTGDSISYHHLINRMCFWMATGSGKTLVMIKLIEYLHFLQQRKEIPDHPILILAPSEDLLKQIHKTVDEFNQSRDFTINLIALRQRHRKYQGQIGNTLPVYYHRSDNISDVQKENLTDYRTYENGGKWFILLDEAHKGAKNDSKQQASKRQAYYAVMAREGFLFNFSATFTDEEDILTTVKKYNLEEFIKEGHGKNIYLNESEYSSFINTTEEISFDQRRKIVLKSLITLAYVSERVRTLREDTNLEELYHLPLMLTLAHSVNIPKEKNDLWTFFETLRDIATGEIDAGLFKDAKAELIGDWQNAKLLFGGDGNDIIGNNKETIEKMTVAKLRKMVFLSSRKGKLQYVRSKGKSVRSKDKSGELAFQMKNADFPFALIRIENTSKWRSQFLAGYEATTTLREQAYFDSLEQEDITILMGSRTFHESWDTNRPNIINFINIGVRDDAKKFVMQSVGRGVRIQPLPDRRRRLEKLLLKPDLESEIKEKLETHKKQVPPIETLFLFATNRNAIKTILERSKTEKESSFEPLEGFELAQRPKINDTEDMPLLVPKYCEAAQDADKPLKFSMSEKTLDRIRHWFAKTSDSLLIVRDKLTMPKVNTLRAMIAQDGGIEIEQEKHYDQLSFLQSRLLSYCDEKVKEMRGLREIDDGDIIHFRKIRFQKKYLKDLQEKIYQVKAGETSDEDLSKLLKDYEAGLITRKQIKAGFAGEEEVLYGDLKIKKISNHYYLPVVLGNKQADYIKHIIKEPSEVDFLNHLEKWTEENNNGEWDAWMFSKIDESLDKNIYIPYFSASNSYSRFFPDFIFWMYRDNEYRIAFVDPKGTVHANAYDKIHGYKHLFEQEEKPKLFSYKNWKVSTKLLMFNRNPPPYNPQYWTSDIAEIFC